MNANPSISVVIAAARAGKTLPECLSTVLNQDYPGELEVLLAAADDETIAAASSFDVVVIDNPSGGTATGLNLAIKASRGKIIVRVDAQSFPPPNYVSSVVEILSSGSIGVVGGMQIPVGHQYWERAIAAAMSSPFGAGDARYRVGGEAGSADTVYLGAFTRATLDSAGGYDEKFTRHQDYELNERIRRSGKTVWFDPRLTVEYRPRSSLGGLSRQYFQYGKWKRVFSRQYPGALRGRQLAPPLLVTTMAVATSLSIVWSWMLAIPAIYLAGLVVAGFTTIPRAGLAFAGVPFALATMHLSWGSGFLIGQRGEQ